MSPLPVNLLPASITRMWYTGFFENVLLIINQLRTSKTLNFVTSEITSIGDKLALNNSFIKLKIQLHAFLICDRLRGMLKHSNKVGSIFCDYVSDTFAFAGLNSLSFHLGFVSLNFL